MSAVKLVNVNEKDYGRWNEWDGLWTEENKDETWTMKCALKEMRWNMNNDVDIVIWPWFDENGWR